MKKMSMQNFYSHSLTSEETPIKNWYVEKFNEIPDIVNFGYCKDVQGLFEHFSKNELLAKKERFSSLNNITEYSICDFSIILDRSGIVLNVFKNKYHSAILLKGKYVIGTEFEILYQTKKHDIKKIKKILEKFTINTPTKKGCINLVSFESGTFMLSEFKIECPNIDFKINYNDDFAPVYKKILNKLSDEKGKGIVLLYGSPGTGKTTFIRYLINNINKKILYIPTDLAHDLAKPSFISFLKKHQNSLLIIEDAENVLMKRTGGNNQVVSNLLNISDGLLGDCLNVQIVATFNTKLREIDEAFLRKGRIIAKYEFKELDKDKAIKLADKLGMKLDSNTKTTLSEIYNSSEDSFETKKNSIGFKFEEVDV